MDHEKRIVEAFAPLCEPLHDALTDARARAHQRNPEFVKNVHLAPVLTHVVRGYALDTLQSRDLGRWTLTPGNNASISLSMDSYAVRVLHQLRDRTAPPPGLNRVRRRYYVNDTLDASLFPSRGDRLLALWNAGRKGALTIRIVRPIGVWSFGARHKVDLDFVLPPLAEDLAALTYDTVDDDIVISIPGEEGSSVEHGLGS